MLRIGWFSTGRDKAARDLLSTVYQAIKEGEIDGEISFVFSNREPGESLESDRFFELVRSYGLPLVCLSSNKFKRQFPQEWRKRFDYELLSKIKNFPADICMLAGYMLIVSEEVCSEVTLINLHPALPGGPTGAWQEVIWQLIRTRASSSGVMIHIATPELDRGPVVSYCTYSIKGGKLSFYWQEVSSTPFEVLKRLYGENLPLFKLIRREGVKRELPLIVLTLKALSRREIIVKGWRVLNSKGEDIPGYDLTKEVEEVIKGQEVEG